jgi:hypothetical protein
MPDFPRQPPPTTPLARSVKKAIRYAAASAWIVALGISGNAAMFWIVERLVSR